MARLPQRHLLLIAGGAVVLAAAWVALLGILSLLTGTDVVEEPGVPYACGIIAAATALLAWIATMRGTIRRPRSGAVLTAIVVGVVYLGAMWLAVLVLTGRPELAGPVTAHLLTAGYAIGVAVLAGVAAAIVAVIARMPPSHARWPWERDEDDDDGPSAP